MDDARQVPVEQRFFADPLLASAVSEMTLKLGMNTNNDRMQPMLLPGMVHSGGVRPQDARLWQATRRGLISSGAGTRRLPVG